MLKNREKSSEKLRELMLHIAKRVEDCPRFGSIKMNKVLFYSDFLWYARHGKSITGVTYLKEDYGPAPHGLLPVQESLEREGAATVERRPVFPKGKVEKRLVPKREAVLTDLFQPEQIAFVDEVITWLMPATAKDVSDATHDHLGWRLADYREEIPYYTVFLNDDIARPSDIERGMELAKERGWLKPTTAP